MNYNDLPSSQLVDLFADKRQRNQAVHALTCGVCKPNRRPLAIDVRWELEQIVATDEDLSVRQVALQELAEINERN